MDLFVDRVVDQMQIYIGFGARAVEVRDVSVSGLQVHRALS